MDKKITLVIADDHELMRTGLLSLLQAQTERFEILGEANTGYNAIRLCLEKKPDILVLDLHMPGDMDGFEVIRILRQKAIPVKILVLTVDPFSEHLALSELGADRLLLKDVSNKTITDTLEQLASLSSCQNLIRTKDYLNIQNNVDEDKSQLKPLTKRELEVLQMAARGLDPAAIAGELKMTKGTVNVHLSSIYKKLKVTNRAEAVSFAYRNRLIVA